jgi:O-antigen/teichoic acid export membrane protein
MKDLKERAVRGGFAKLCGQAASFALSIVSMAVLGRLLDPKDFGLVAMVTAVSGVYSIFLYGGLSSATVQNDSITNDQISTLFWINMLMGMILALLLIATAPFLVTFYHEPRLFWVTMALSAGFLISAAGLQHFALLQRQMRFVTLSVAETLPQLVSLVVAISMAIGGFGYWALVASTLVSTSTRSVCMWLTTAWIPSMPRRRVGVRPMLRYGVTITLNNIIVYIAYNLEKVLLGRFWGANALGIYGRAYGLINIPTENINSAISGVAFSGLSRLQHEPNRSKNYFLKGYSLVLSLTIPITIFCALFADDIILILLGPKWKDAIIIFRLLAPTILVFGMLNPFGALLQATGFQERSLKIALVIAPLVIVSYVIGLPFGPKGVALAYSAAMMLGVVPLIAWCIHGTMISLKNVLQVISRPFFSGIISAVVAFGAQLIFGKLLPSFLLLVLGGSVMLGTYLLMLLFIMGQKEMYLDLIRGLRGSSSVDIAVADKII